MEANIDGTDDERDREVWDRLRLALSRARGA